MVDFAKAAKAAKNGKAGTKVAKGRAIPLDFSKVGNIIGLPHVPAVCEKMEVRYGKESGNPYLNTEFTVIHPEYMGRKLWLTTGLTVEGLWSTKNFFATMGIPVEGDFSLQVNDEDLVTYPDFSGSVVVLALEEDEYAGQKRDRVTHVEELKTPKGDASLSDYSDEDEDDTEDYGDLDTSSDEDDYEEEESEDEDEDEDEDEEEDEDEDEEPDEGTIDPASLIQAAASTVRARNQAKGVTPPAKSQKVNTGTKAAPAGKKGGAKTNLR